MTHVTALSNESKKENAAWSRISTLEDALQMGLTEAEYKQIVELAGRQINLVECGIFSALYSEHCSYKSTKVHLKNLPTSGPRVIHGPGENAGVVDIGDGKAVAFKVESHNHPSFIEPYQGAATGVGGILRDVFTMGARPIALMNALRFGEVTNPKTQYLLTRAVKGIGGYGNAMGVPTVGGELFFDASYNGNCLVNAFALGIVDQDKIFLGNASGVGNPVFYVGSKTGRDGIHGATMASDTFDDNSESKRPTVQVGDPFVEKLLLEACLEVMQTDAVVGIQDMGAAGLTSSTYEMASRAGTGVRMHLDRVPQREEGMNPYELMLSESQERMLVIVEKGKEDIITKIFKHWELDVAQIGEVIEGNNVELYWYDQLVSSLPVDLVTSRVPQYRWPEAIPQDYQQVVEFDVQSIEQPSDLSATWQKLISSPNLCSRQQVYTQYDSTVRTNTVVHPGADAGVVRIKNPKSRKEKGIAMSLDCNSRYCSIDPRHGAALSVAESYRNITAVGAEPIGLSDCLNFGSPERPEGMWEIAEAIRGIGESSRAFKVPVVSGNVSLYNETKGTAIMPTPQIAMVGLLEDANKAVSSKFLAENDVIFVIGKTSDRDLGGTEYLAQIAGISKGALPALDYSLELKNAEFIREIIDQKLVKSCHDVSQGGLAVAFSEACFDMYGAHGATLELVDGASSYDGRADGLLFAETGARYIISCSAKAAEQIKALAKSKDVDICMQGKVGGEKIEIKGFASLDKNQAWDGWRRGLERFLGVVY